MSDTTTYVAVLPEEYEALKTIAFLAVKYSVPLKTMGLPDLSEAVMAYIETGRPNKEDRQKIISALGGDDAMIEEAEASAALATRRIQMAVEYKGFDPKRRYEEFGDLPFGTAFGWRRGPKEEYKVYVISDTKGITTNGSYVYAYCFDDGVFLQFAKRSRVFDGILVDANTVITLFPPAAEETPDESD